MKYIVIALVLFINNEVMGQGFVTLRLKIVDTASSIFSQNACVIRNIEYLPDDTLIHDFPGSVFMRLDSTFLCVKFDNFDWFIVRQHAGGKIPRRTPSIYRTEFINLIPTYAENPGLFEAVQGGTNIQVRFQTYASVNGAPLTISYSNIKTMYLPPASADDISAYSYLRSHVQRVRGFSYLLGTDNYKPEVWIYLRDNFPNSIIGDLSAYEAMGEEYLDKRFAEGDSPELKQWFKNKRNALLNTKSDLLRDKILMQLYMMGE